jgi:two-component system cell cycle sensor histidine kinase/response regulator CckA
VKADPSQIEQVLMNLIINAHEAMPEGGEITITTETVTLDQDSGEVQQELAAAQQSDTFVRLTVKDNGIGIAEQDIERIFEPFYSTKPKGTGLGLSIANNIIQQHGGWIGVESQLGQGTAFHIYLPAYETDADLEEVKGPAPIERLGKGERILLVEDDEGVREAVSEMLYAGGYTVVEAQSAQEAMDIFEGQEGDFSLVFSDVVLPDKDGIELVEQCLLQRPDLPVLLTSGYTDHRSQWLLISERGFCFIQKPFGISDLLPVIHQTMHPPRKKSKS